MDSVPPGNMFPGNVGYISLNPVSETSTSELRREITALLGKGMKSLVPVIEGLPQTQEDIRIARDAVQRVEALVNATLGQLDAIPGARLAKGVSSGVVGGVGGVVGSLTGRSKPVAD